MRTVIWLGGFAFLNLMALVIFMVPHELTQASHVRWVYALPLGPGDWRIPGVADPIAPLPAPMERVPDELDLVGFTCFSGLK